MSVFQTSRVILLWRAAAAVCPLHGVVQLRGSHLCAPGLRDSHVRAQSEDWRSSELTHSNGSHQPAAWHARTCAQINQPWNSDVVLFRTSTLRQIALLLLRFGAFVEGFLYCRPLLCGWGSAPSTTSAVQANTERTRLLLCNSVGYSSTAAQVLCVTFSSTFFFKYHTIFTHHTGIIMQSLSDTRHWSQLLAGSFSTNFSARQHSKSSS